jgi:hypothetical protein
MPSVVRSHKKRFDLGAVRRLRAGFRARKRSGSRGEAQGVAQIAFGQGVQRLAAEHIAARQFGQQTGAERVPSTDGIDHVDSKMRRDQRGLAVQRERTIAAARHDDQPGPK